MCRYCLSWYGRRIAPYLIHAGCSANAFSRMRRRMVPLAEGIVVEVGFGSGLNLPYYDAAKVERLIGVDPDSTMLALAGPQSRSLPFDVECLQACGESMPLTDNFADTVVVTYAFCTIPQPRGGADGNPTHPEAHGPADFHRARSGRGAALPQVAGAPEPAVGMARWWLPPQPRSVALDPRGGLPPR